MILAHTIKGYGLGEAGEGRNITHQQKKLNEQEIAHFRIALRNSHPGRSGAQRRRSTVRPTTVPEMAYLHERRRQLGGYMPDRARRRRAS